jgi:hypothetical protein
MTELSDRDKDILSFTRKWWLSGAVREQAIRDRFGVSPRRLQRELAAIVELPAALSYDPLLVRRLRRRPDESGVTRHPAGRQLG